MKFGLFAFGEIGYEIAKLFRDRNENIPCLILSSTGSKDLNKAILSLLSPVWVIYSDSLYEEATLEKLRKMRLDVIVLAWWPHIIKEDLTRIPRLGCLNLHPSYLPYNRGKHPYFWSIVEDVPFGVTIHFIDAGIDTGDIVFQELVEKSWCDTGSTLYNRGKQTIVSFFKKKFEDIRTGNLPRKKQDMNSGSFHREEEIEESSKINLEQQYKARDLLNLIRARLYFPVGATWFMDGGHKYEVRIEITKVND